MPVNTVKEMIRDTLINIIIENYPKHPLRKQAFKQVMCYEHNPEYVCPFAETIVTDRYWQGYSRIKAFFNKGIPIVEKPKYSTIKLTTGDQADIVNKLYTDYCTHPRFNEALNQMCYFKYDLKYRSQFNTQDFTVVIPYYQAMDKIQAFFKYGTPIASISKTDPKATV